MNEPTSTELSELLGVDGIPNVDSKPYGYDERDYDGPDEPYFDGDAADREADRATFAYCGRN